MQTKDEINAQRRAYYAANRDKLAAQRRVRDARYKAKRAALREQRRAVRELDETEAHHALLHGLGELFEAIAFVARAWLKFKVPYVPKDAPYRLHPPTLLDLKGCKVMRIGPLTRALATATL